MGEQKKPWEETWQVDGRRVYRDDDGLLVYVASAVSGDAKTVFATAKLCAAAPELYRALEACREALSANRYGWARDEGERAISLADDALRKACDE